MSPNGDDYSGVWAAEVKTLEAEVGRLEGIIMRNAEIELANERERIRDDRQAKVAAEAEQRAEALARAKATQAKAEARVRELEANG